MTKQKLHQGDLVRVAKDLGPSMSHFEADCNAIVVGSYADQYGGDSDHSRDSYTIYIEDHGQVSWYYGSQLTLVEKNRSDLLEKWRDIVEQARLKHSDLDWVFANGAEVIRSGYASSIQALADCFGLTDLWGRNGEGIRFYANAMETLALARPFLLAGDKAGWLARAETLRRDREGAH